MKNLDNCLKIFALALIFAFGSFESHGIVNTSLPSGSESDVTPAQVCVNPSQIDLSAICFALYDPVCGCDGVTYSNQCYAFYYGGVTSWTPGECSPSNGCIDPSLINPNIFCLDVWDPVCGCDGNTYSNDCYAQNFYGVSSWTPGECPGTGVEPCTNIQNVDFGPCDLFLGYAVGNGECLPVSGCSYIGSDGIDYSNAFFLTLDDCRGCFPCIDPDQIDPNAVCPAVYMPVCGCDGNTYANDCIAYNSGVVTWTEGACPGEPCDDLAGVDFGPCDAVLGQGVVNGQCSTISGCSPIAVDGTDYSASIFATDAECQACTPCINPDQIDPTAACYLIYAPVCGCDGVTYSNDCFAFVNGVTSWTDGECPNQPAPPCTDLAGVDFGQCALFLGYGLVNGQCAGISGCSTTGSDGIDYAASIYATEGACQACNACINPDQIDPTAVCPLIYAPVCGCDGITYSNDCFAFVNGVTSWTNGECSAICNVNGGTVSTNDPRLNLCRGDGFPNLVQLTVTGNVGIGRFGVIRQSNLQIVAVNTTGLFNFESLPAGQYWVGHISVNDLSVLDGVTNLNQLSGCFSLSNQLAVSSIQLNAGQIFLISPSPVICGGNLQATVTGNQGPNSRWVLLNQLGTQVITTNTTGIFNFDALPVAIYRIVHVSYTNAVNLSTITPPALPPCIVASNAIVVSKVACATSYLESSPNPTTGISQVQFGVGEDGPATLEVYDLSGRLVKALFNQLAQKDQPYRLEFDGSNLPNGVYIYRLNTTDGVKIEKFVIAR